MIWNMPTSWSLICQLSGRCRFLWLLTWCVKQSRHRIPLFLLDERTSNSNGDFATLQLGEAQSQLQKERISEYVWRSMIYQNHMLCHSKLGKLKSPRASYLFREADAFGFISLAVTLLSTPSYREEPGKTGHMQSRQSGLFFCPLLPFCFQGEMMTKKKGLPSTGSSPVYS